MVKDFGIKMTEEQAKSFKTYMDMLLEWNEKVNLTAITEPEEVEVKHFIDSLSVLKHFEIKQGARLIDVGTGAGFPGIPLKIMRPDINLTLLDSSNKRLRFLDEVAKEMDIEVTTVHKRAEEAGREADMRESYDVAISRAVAQLNTLAEYCIPLVKMKGFFVAMKGPSVDDELKTGEYAIERLGCEIKAVEKFALPNGDERNIVIASKTGFTPKEYPRHGGTITKKPLEAKK